MYHLPPAADNTSHLDVHVSANGDAANQIAAANGQPATAAAAGTDATAQPGTDWGAYAKQGLADVDAGMHKMHEMADSIVKNTQAKAFFILWLIFSLVMLVLLGMESNDSKIKVVLLHYLHLVYFSGV